jgi:urea transport system permease protein
MCPTYLVSLFGKYPATRCWRWRSISSGAICGILSLGHGAFFALGGYAMGMYLMRQIGARGVYGNPMLPDFMVFLNWQGAALVLVRLQPLLVRRADGACGAGPACLRVRLVRLPLRVNGVYLSIITQAMTYALLLAFFRNDMGFGGNNGLTDFKDILGFNIQADGTRAALFAATAIFLALALLSLGHRPLEIRQGAGRRARCRKPHPLPRLPRREHFKLFTFVVSAMMAGIAGALYVPQVGIINPGEFAPANSIEVVIWTAVGGRGTLIGPIIGAILVNGGKSVFTGLPSRNSGCLRWAACSSQRDLFLPKGIVGTVQQFLPGARQQADAPSRRRQDKALEEDGVDAKIQAAE